MKLLLTAATEAEIGPVLDHLRLDWAPIGPMHFSKGANELQVCLSGVGMMATTYALMKTFKINTYDFAIQVGVGGSFDTGIALGEVLLITSDQYGDLGAQDHYNYLDIFELGLLEQDQAPFTGGKLLTPSHPIHDKINLPHATALTVNTVSGNEFTVKARFEKFNCQVESMEGAALHYVCLVERVPFAQIRAISNYVAPRDKSTWQMKEAIINLNNKLIDIIAQL